VRIVFNWISSGDLLQDCGVSCVVAGRGGALVSATDWRFLEWRKGSSCVNGECVEVACHESSVLVRNSAVPYAVLCFPADGWRRFIAGIAVRAGDADPVGRGRLESTTMSI
jgi:Domain of unknown function (DUF397)